MKHVGKPKACILKHRSISKKSQFGQCLVTIWRPRIGDEDEEFLESADDNHLTALKASSQLLMACASLGWDLRLEDLVESWQMPLFFFGDKSHLLYLVCWKSLCCLHVWLIFGWIATPPQSFGYRAKLKTRPTVYICVDIPKMNIEAHQGTPLDSPPPIYFRRTRPLCFASFQWTVTASPPLFGLLASWDSWTWPSNVWSCWDTELHGWALWGSHRGPEIMRFGLPNAYSLWRCLEVTWRDQSPLALVLRFMSLIHQKCEEIHCLLNHNVWSLVSNLKSLHPNRRKIHTFSTGLWDLTQHFPILWIPMISETPMTWTSFLCIVLTRRKIFTPPLKVPT